MTDAVIYHQPRSHAAQPVVAFRGLEAPFTNVLQKAVGHLSLPARAGVGFLKMKESPGGNMHFQFVQDTAILWTPKAAISRSIVELFEITFVEFAESAFFYYVTPLLAGFGLAKLFPKLIPQAVRPDFKTIATPLQKLTQSQKTGTVPVKLGIAVASVAVGALGNFALNFIKNLITERGFKKNDFGAIVGLSNQKSIDTAQESPVAKKAKRRLKQIAIGTASVLLASMALVRFGHEIPALAQRSKRFQKPLQSLSRFLEWAADQLEFDFKPRKTGKGESTFFDLGRNHLKIIVPAAMLGYVDAARDKLERVEVASRVSVTGTYIAFIQPWLAELFNRKFGERFKDLGVMKGEKLSDVKTLEELQADCVQLAKKALGHAASDEAISTEAAKHLKPRLAAKSQLFFIPYLFGILVIGFFTALMNQLWTRHRFGQMLAERQSTLKFDPTWHPFTQRKPYITSAPPNHTNLKQSYTREKDYAALLQTLSLPTPKALQAST